MQPLLKIKQNIFLFLFPEPIKTWIFNFYGHHQKVVIRKSHSTLCMIIQFILLLTASTIESSGIMTCLDQSFLWVANLNIVFHALIRIVLWLSVTAIMLVGWNYWLQCRHYFFEWMTLGKFDDKTFEKRLYRFSFLITPYMVKKLLAITLLNRQLQCYQAVLKYNEALQLANLEEKITTHEHYLGTEIFLIAQRQDTTRNEDWQNYWKDPNEDTPQSHYFYDFFLALSRAEFGNTDGASFVKSELRQVSNHNEIIIYLMQKEEIRNNPHVNELLLLHPRLQKYQSWIDRINLYLLLNQQLNETQGNLDINSVINPEEDSVVKI
jgi:hypothetical protein